MPIPQNTLEWLRRHLLDNDVVLFLGAGFSGEATNLLGRPLPNSRELSKELYEFAGFDSKQPFGNEPLAEVFESARTALGDERLLEFLRPRLTADATPTWYGYLADFLWYRIYTTNADNVVELAWKPRELERPKLRTILGPMANYVDRDQLLTTIHYVKLHGSLEEGVKGMTFSRRQYAARLADQDTWVDNFVREYFDHPTVFIGTELDDPDIWMYIQRRERILRTRDRQDPRPKGS